MTTVAYRDGVLAGDGRVTMGDTVVSNTERKVHKLRGGRLYGYAGNSEDAELLKLALMKGEAPPLLDNVQGLLIHSDGVIELYEGKVWQQVKEPYYAIGTGGPLALVLMDAGLSSKDAVKLSIKRDTNSGGKIRTVKLKGVK